MDLKSYHKCVLTCRRYMTFAGGFAEANVAKPGAIAEHVLAVVCLLQANLFVFILCACIFIF